jgi:molybdate transport repressor ModE-like protein
MALIIRPYAFSMDMDFLDLRLVRAIADTGSITAAAVMLGYSQPAATQRLRRLEGALAQPLVLRSGRGVALTEAGRRLAGHAVHVQAALDAAHQDLDELAGATTGVVRLAGFPSASPTLVPAVLSALRAGQPRLTASYVEVEPPEALELLRGGSIDLALTFSYPGDGREGGDTGSRLRSENGGDSIVETALFRDTTVVIAPVGTFGDDEPDLRRLAGARFIGGCPRCRGHLVATCRAAGFEPDIVLETDNALAVTGLVEAGLGLALLPALSLVPAPVPAGVEVRSLPAASDRIVQVAHARGADRIPAVAAALGMIRLLDPALYGLRSATGTRMSQSG